MPGNIQTCSQRRQTHVIYMLRASVYVGRLSPAKESPHGGSADAKAPRTAQAPLHNGSVRGDLLQFARAARALSYGGWQTVTRSLGALTLFIVGYPEKAILRNREALALARQSGDRPSLVPILFWSFFLNVLIRDPQAAYPQVEEACLFERSARPDHSQRPGSGGDACGVCGVRTRYST
jgi:hypothetical protein